jgi:uncharacterized protein YigA (DUF484 family)
MTTTHEDNPAAQEEISAEQVTSYLRSHPKFFEQYASLLTEITLPSPHGSGVISLGERQQLAQRDKIRVLESLMEQMIANAEGNEATSLKVHQFCLKLLEQQSFSALKQLIAETLRTDFNVTESLIRIWVKPSNSAIAGDAVFTHVSDEFNDWVISLQQPHCGNKPQVATGLLDSNLKSFAFIPLYKNAADQHAFGVLVLGADDPQRFKADMGTLYLDRIGELIAATLLNHLFTLNL